MQSPTLISNGGQKILLKSRTQPEQRSSSRYVKPHLGVMEVYSQILIGA
jgi:hypothetical protein